MKESNLLDAPNMPRRIVISSNHIDKHNEVMTIGALESGAEIINGLRKVRMSVEHKRDLPPLGKLNNAKVEEDSGHHYLTAEQVEYDVYEEVAWDGNLLLAKCSSDESPFNEPNNEAISILTVEVDRHNFSSHDHYEDFLNKINEMESDLKVEEFGRKSVLNDPEIVLNIAKTYFIYKIIQPIVKKTTKKITDRLSDKLADEADKLYEFIRRSFKEFLQKAVPKNRPINYILRFPGEPEVELFAKIEEPEILIKAIKAVKLEKLRKEVDELQAKIQFEKIQFILTKKGKWKFNYLLTNKGETLGRKLSFKKRDKLIELILKKQNQSD